MNNYIKRAEILKASCIDSSNEKETCLRVENKGNSSSIQRVSSLNERLSFVHHELRLYTNFHDKVNFAVLKI